MIIFRGWVGVAATENKTAFEELLQNRDREFYEIYRLLYNKLR